MTLPRIIHQIWLGPRPRPKIWMDSWSKHHPGWEYRLWTEDNLPTIINRRLFDAYGECWHGKADILRYEILYQHGGIYLDADTECLRPLDDLLTEWPSERDCFAVYANEAKTPGLIANGILGAKPHSRLFQRLVEGLRDLEMPAGVVAWTHVGPQYLTEQAREDDSLWILPSWSFLPEHHSGLRYEGPERPYARHYWHTTTGAWPQEQAEKPAKILCLIIDSMPHAAWQETYEVHRRAWNRCLDQCSAVDGYFLRSDPGLTSDHVVDGRIFTVRGDEGIGTILHKTLRAIEVLLADHDYVIRTNLSSIYDFPLLQLQDLPRVNLYEGHVIHDRGWVFVTGSGMILSSDVAKKLPMPVSFALEPHDDVAIWQILNAQGVHPQHRAMHWHDYSKGLDQIVIGQHAHYRLREERDPHRVHEREITEYVFDQIYGRRLTTGDTVQMLTTKVREAYDRYISTVSPENQAISWELSVWLWNFLSDRKIRDVVDLGSGWSSALLRFYQQTRPEIRVTSVDSDAAWAARTDRFLASNGLTVGVQVWSQFQSAVQEGSFQLVIHDLGDINMRVLTLDAVKRLVQRGGYLVLDDLHFSELSRAKAWPNYKELPETIDHFGRYAGLVEIP